MCIGVVAAPKRLFARGTNTMPLLHRHPTENRRHTDQSTQGTRWWTVLLPVLSRLPC